MLIAAAGGMPRKLSLPPPRFEPDLHALRAALGERTRVVIGTTRTIPSGRVYDRATLQGFSEVLRESSARFGRPIYALADEAYRRIVYDDRKFESLALHYPDTLHVYTYGKTLLTPGQRLGYIALPPAMAVPIAMRFDATSKPRSSRSVSRSRTH